MLSPRSEPAVTQPDSDALRALQRETVEAGEAGELDGALERGAAVVCNEIHRLQWQLFERVHALRARTRLVRAESVSGPIQAHWGGEKCLCARVRESTVGADRCLERLVERQGASVERKESEPWWPFVPHQGWGKRSHLRRG